MNNIIKPKYMLDKSKAIPILERKLEPEITIGFAEKSPKFVVVGKHTIVLQEPID